MKLDTLIDEVGADAIARHRRPRMDRAAAERLLDALQADDALPSAPFARPSPAYVAAGGPEPPDDSADRSDRVRALKAATRRVTGGHRPVRARVQQRDTVDHVTDPFLDQDRGMNRERKRSAPRSALLRPPSRPLPRVSLSTPPPEARPEPAPDSPTRAAMGALFEAEESTEGLVFLGDEPADAGGFAAQAGTDPAITPLLEDQDGERIDSVERTAENLDSPLPPGPASTLPEIGSLLDEPLPPTRGTTVPDLQPPELAGAEDPMPMDVPAAPFGFGPADAEPTRVERRPRRSSPPERHAPAHLSEAVVVSSVKKLFRR